MTYQTMAPHPSSFRDPSGYIYEHEQRIFRIITEQGLAAYEAVRKTNLINDLMTKAWLLPEMELSSADLKDFPTQAKKVLTHPRLPIITYPYEWPFAALKAAALLHLDIQITALSYDVVLSDASAFNIQFIDNKPIFIDHLSFRPYRAGEYWLAHEQFCREFLNPLLLKMYLDVDYHHYYRGNMSGVDTKTLANLLPLHRKMQLNNLLHVVLPAYLDRKTKPEMLKKAAAK
jgi:ribosomal protein L11 methylase PrmA